MHCTTVHSPGPVRVKSTSPGTENHYKKWLRELYNICMTNEDNIHDTKYINKNTDTNHDTRKLHE